MSNYRSDPTANAAIGAVDRELKMMRKEAERLGQRYRKGLLTVAEETAARKKFIGIYRRLLTDALKP